MPDTQTGDTTVHLEPAWGSASSAGPAAVLLKWGAPAAGLTAAAIGGVYLTAWLVGAAARWSAAGVLTMKTNMAASLVMAGAALLLVEPRRTTRTRRALGMVLALIVLLVGALTLFEHIFQTDFGIDQLLATEQTGAVATVRPNRIGPPGSLSLTLLGAGMLALALRRRTASYFGVATAIIVLVPAVGFISGVGQFYSKAVVGIAWPTVIALLALSAGLHLAEGREGLLGLVWRDDPGGRLLRQLLPTSVLVPLFLQLLVRIGERRGLYDSTMAVGILLISLVVLLSGLLWRSAWHLSAAAAQAQVAEQQARWRADLLGLVHDAILVWSPAAGIEAWNQGAHELYGYTAREAVGRDPHDLLQTQASRPLQEIDEEVRRVGRWEGELRHHTKDGREVVVSSKVRTVQGIDGLDRVLESNRDITERKQMEDELRESSRRKDEFLGVLSHELRNPLAPISNSLYILEHAEPTGQQARRAKEVIGRQFAHLARLVEDLLEVTRITSGKTHLQRVRLDLGELIRRTGEDHRELLQKKGLDYDVDTSGRAVWVEGDETRLAQVVGNLLQNAAKFTPTGGRVTLSVVALESAVEVHVRDTGAGIDARLVERIFEPFVQAEQALARTNGGLGLGLALVKGLTELHGGSVEARSGGEGQGAEFVVRLPTVAPPEQEASTAGREWVAQRGLRVLVVDDNVDAAESLADVVRMLGHQVEVAHDGPTAIQKATAAVPDLVLCDIGLPGMSGYDVARALLAHPDLRDARLVAVSGYARPEDVQRAAEAGFIGHIAKPLSASNLEQYLVTR